MIHLLPKCQKPSDFPPQYFDKPQSFSSKIAPIPMIYCKIQNDKKMRTRLTITGYKSFSKLSAAGEDSQTTLDNITKPHNVMRYIRKLEFDPYLCEKSYMKPLSKALRKFKDIRGLNLVIRRLDYEDESNILAPYMIRLVRLQKLRLELTKIEKLFDKGFIKLACTYGKMYSVQRCEQVVIGMDHISQFASMQFAVYGFRLKPCKKFKKTVQRGSSLALKIDTRMASLEDKLLKKMRCGSHFGDLEFFFSTRRGWLSMSTEVDESAAKNLRMISTQKHLERLYLHFSGNPVTLETIQGLTSGFHQFHRLRNFGLEFLNSRMSEEEVVIFAQALPQLKALEQLSFKIIQYPSVSEGCIYFLMCTISKLSNLKKFEIYFRRLASDEMVNELVKRIKALGNIECEHSKQSLYFYKKDLDKNL